MSLPVFTLTQGRLPLLISIPHGGECLPDDLAQYMTPAAHQIADTDWHLSRLYQFAVNMGASVIRSCYSRYVIDLNRPCDGSNLYPGKTTTGLCPTESFRGEQLYLEDRLQPDSKDVANRIRQYWQPYHVALQEEIKRLHTQHGRVLMWEAHSIASILPRLFPGQLPDLNIGTFSGAACSADICKAVEAVAAASPFSYCVDDRFKGGYITRHYGQPQKQVHVIQLEMAQHLYMDEHMPFTYQENAADKLLPILDAMVRQAMAALSTAH